MKRISASYKIIATCLILCLSVYSFANDKSRRVYTLPDHGTIELQVPTHWSDEARQPPNRLPPTIIFRPKGEKSFEVLLTIIWPASDDTSVFSSEKVERIVRQSAQKAERQAVESENMVKELKGASGVGYYFFATDRSPGPDEYKYMTQGMIRVGNLGVAFTILAHRNDSAATDEVLDMLRGARHVAS